MIKVPVTRQNLKKIANDENNYIGFYGLDVSRISTIFIAQIIQIQASRSIDTNSILNEIKFLEGIKNNSSTKSVEKFKHQPLQGLMKKHFYDEKFWMKNFYTHFSFEYGGNSNLDTIINEAFLQSKNTFGYLNGNFISNYIATKIVVDGVKERTIKNKLTGEWIIFKQHNGKNYYLTLASHREKDEAIYERVCDAYKFDFPFLQ
jgi:hypothetical protein